MIAPEIVFRTTEADPAGTFYCDGVPVPTTGAVIQVAPDRLPRVSLGIDLWPGQSIPVELAQATVVRHVTRCLHCGSQTDDAAGTER